VKMTGPGNRHAPAHRHRGQLSYKKCNPFLLVRNGIFTRKCVHMLLIYNGLSLTETLRSASTIFILLGDGVPSCGFHDSL